MPSLEEAVAGGPRRARGSAMQLLAHRGLWHQAGERNTLAALRAAFAAGFGVETDIRDAGSRLVISHDMAGPGVCTLEQVLEELRRSGIRGPVALNVKADGLQDELRRELAGAEVDAFVFDMSGPETLRYARGGFPYFTRLSEYEQAPLLLDGAQGVWLDHFDHLWYGLEVLTGLLEAGKRVAVVSPELHGRNPEPVWQLCRQVPEALQPLLMLCTDLVERANDEF